MLRWIRCPLVNHPSPLPCHFLPMEMCSHVILAGETGGPFFFFLSRFVSLVGHECFESSSSSSNSNNNINIMHEQGGEIMMAAKARVPWFAGQRRRERKEGKTQKERNKGKKGTGRFGRLFFRFFAFRSFCSLGLFFCVCAPRSPPAVSAHPRPRLLNQVDTRSPPPPPTHILTLPCHRTYHSSFLPT